MLTYPVGNFVPKGGGFPPILEDGNTVKWFDYLKNVTKDGSDLVSSWDNKTGIPGIIPGALLQGNTLFQPKWFLNDGILFDGDWMQTLPFTFIQPEQIYIVLKQVTWTDGRYFFDGNVANSTVIANSGSTPDIVAYAGTSSGANSNLAVDTFGIIRVLFNGANSKLQVNETTLITGNFGTLDSNGFTLGSQTGGPIGFRSNIQVKEIIKRKIADTAQNEQDIYDYLAARHSI